MSAAGWTAPAACAILIAATLSAVSLNYRDSTAPPATSGAVSSPSADSAGADRLRSTPRACPVETWVRDVPAGSLLIVGSLDRSARSHAYTVQWIDSSARCESASLPRVQLPEAVDVCRLYRSEICRNEQIEQTSVEDAAAAAAAAAARTNALKKVRDVVTVPRESRRFSIPVIRHTQCASQIFSASLLARAGRIQVYDAKSSVHQATSSDDNRLAAAVIDECECFILSFVESQFTAIEDIDGDGFLTIVLCDLQGEAAATSLDDTEPVLGCVRRSDFLAPHGDFHGDIIYLDRRLAAGSDLTAVLTHELTHAATFSCIAGRSAAAAVASDRTLPGWLNEAISHYYERRVCSNGSNLNSRVAAFYDKPHRFPLVVPEGQQLSAYGRGGCRAAGVLFLENVMRSNADIGSLAGLLESSDDPVQRLEVLSGKSFAGLFREWTLSLIADENSARRVNDVCPGESADNCVHRQTLSAGSRVALSIRGTAAAHFEATSRRGSFVVSAPADSKIQITVVTPNAEARGTDCTSASPRLCVNGLQAGPDGGTLP